LKRFLEKEGYNVIFLRGDDEIFGRGIKKLISRNFRRNYSKFYHELWMSIDPPGIAFCGLWSGSG
jgi:hypothetical protein